ncbi:hypothetical protein CBW16_02540 [Flavobacteriaceae bacterium JJC]|nr:hypothetical protein CBW16_02540 [Flavobacteriaceae bacterium JJC]
MARESSILKLKGVLDGMSFYKNSEGHYVRAKGGIEKERILNDANFARTRENMNEFADINGAGKLIRNSVSEFLRRAKDMRTSSRLVSVIAKIKNKDALSVRGQRNFAKGFGTAEGKAMLTGYDFNRHAPLQTVLKKELVIDPVAGSISIRGFKPHSDLEVPEFATHVNLGLACVSLDAENEKSETVYSTSAPLVINEDVADLTVTLDALPTADGVKMFYVLLEFFQEVNGELYELRSGQMNALKLVHIV